MSQNSFPVDNNDSVSSNRKSTFPQPAFLCFFNVAKKSLIRSAKRILPAFSTRWTFSVIGQTFVTGLTLLEVHSEPIIS